MNYRNLLIGMIASGLVAVAVPTPGRAADVYPLAHDQSLLREEVIKIEPGRIKAWLDADCGQRISLPWFDGSELDVVVDRIETVGKYAVVYAETAADVIGTVVLSMGEGALVGAITMDTETYRIRSLGGDAYALTRVNPHRLMPDHPDTEVSDRRRPYPPTKRPQRRRFITLDRMPERRLTRLFNAQLVDVDKLHLFETGSRIDVLMVVSSDAAEWAFNTGLTLGAEIQTMFGQTNMAFAASGIVPRLNLVATTFVDHKVLEPATLGLDLDALQQGTGNFSEIHDIRNTLKADLVVMLVLNGTEGCGIDDGLACGGARVPRQFPGPFDGPGEPQWESNFASRGFAVMGIHAAFNYYTFMHEVGHTLGAHHDVYTFVSDNSQATADNFARGWILAVAKARTVMAYDRICEIVNIECEILPVFSNPLQSYLGDRRGDPAPGETPTNFGPADNRTAINRMASTVASYRISVGP